jgi:hypothetical protein
VWCYGAQIVWDERQEARFYAKLEILLVLRARNCDGLIKPPSQLLILGSAKGGHTAQVPPDGGLALRDLCTAPSAARDLLLSL